MTEKTEGETPAVAAESNQDRVRLVDHVEVTCEAIIGGGTTTIGKLNSLAKGDVIALDRSPADPIDIRVNGKVIARGEIVTVDDRFAVRLTEIGAD